MLWMICLSLGALFPSVSSGTIKLIVVVDEPMNKFPENLQNAVSYVNKPSSGLLGNHTLQLEVVVSQDNDSYGAMEQVCAHMQSGAAMIVDFSSRYVTTTLRSMAEAMGITHVSAVDPSFVTDGRTYNTSLNVEPPASYMLRCIRDIVAQENLTNVGIIYDETFDLEHKPKRLLSNIPAQHLYLQMNPERIPEQLEKIKSAELSHLFLVSSHTNAKAFLEEASEKRMMSFKYTWYVLTKDGKVQCSQCMTKTTAVVILANIPGSSMRNEYLSYINSQLTTHQIDHEDIEVAAVFQWDLIMLLAGALQQAYSEGWFSQINYTDCFEWNSTDLVAYSQAASLRNKIIQSKFLGILGPIRFRGSQGELSMGLNINRNEYQNGISVNEKRVGNWSRAQRLNAFYGSLADKTAKKTYRVITISVRSL